MTPAPHLQPLGGGDPKSIGEWRLLGRLGAGGMGVVYLAERLGGDQAALKIIHAGYAHDPTFRTRFKREVHASRSVRGRYVAAVLDADTDGDPAWLATEYIPGPTLSAFVDDHGPLPDALILPLAAGLLEGLATIHRAGIVHRDLKPSNILLTEAAPIIIDFGIASAADATSLTGTGIALGSAGWMAPEQLRGTSAGPPVDIFAWGALVAFAATGRPPFGTGRPDALGYRVAHEPPDLTGVSSPLRTVVEDALRKDPDERPSLDDLRARLGSDADATVATIAAGWEAPTEITTLVGTADPVSPGRSRPSWRSTAFVGAVLATLVAAFAVYLLGSRGNSTDSLTQRDATNTTTSRSSTTTEEPTTTTTSSTTTTDATPPGVAPGLCTSGARDDPDKSVQVLYRAYVVDDRGCAEALATQEAADTLFTLPGDGEGWEYRGCTEQEDPDPHTDCAFTFPGGATHFKANYSDTDGWVVFDVYQTTD